MTEITIQKNDAGQLADRFLAKAYPKYYPKYPYQKDHSGARSAA